MERDPVTGRFMPGNKIAKGNSGNKKPKWKNKNALKHGYYASEKPCWIDDKGSLNIVMGSGVNPSVIGLPSNGFTLTANKDIVLNDYFTKVFAKSGIIRFVLDDKAEMTLWDIRQYKRRKICESRSGDR